jgi:AcrR family transcriptional regulator
MFIKMLEVLNLSRIIENPRELILSEAKKMLYNEGYSRVSIRRIAKECGIAVGTIYNYFPTKKDLIIEMMTSYWEEFFYDIESIISSNEDFYIKLNKIFDILSAFIKRFKEVWLSDEIYSSPDYIESGLKKENIYIDKLIKVIKKLLEEDIYNRSDGNIKQIEPYKMASFIVANFYTMVQMPYLDYTSFESILKKVFQ